MTSVPGRPFSGIRPNEILRQAIPSSSSYGGEKIAAATCPPWPTRPTPAGITRKAFILEGGKGSDLQAWLFKILKNAFINRERSMSQIRASVSIDDTEMGGEAFRICASALIAPRREAELWK